MTALQTTNSYTEEIIEELFDQYQQAFDERCLATLLNIEDQILAFESRFLYDCVNYNSRIKAIFHMTHFLRRFRNLKKQDQQDFLKYIEKRERPFSSFE